MLRAALKTQCAPSGDQLTPPIVVVVRARRPSTRGRRPASASRARCRPAGPHERDARAVGRRRDVRFRLRRRPDGDRRAAVNRHLPEVALSARTYTRWPSALQKRRRQRRRRRASAVTRAIARPHRRPRRTSCDTPARSHMNATVRPSGDQIGIRRMSDVDQLFDRQPARAAGVCESRCVHDAARRRATATTARKYFITSAVYPAALSMESHQSVRSNPSFRTGGQLAKSARKRITTAWPSDNGRALKRPFFVDVRAGPTTPRPTSIRSGGSCMKRIVEFVAVLVALGARRAGAGAGADRQHSGPGDRRAGRGDAWRHRHHHAARCSWPAR